MTLLLPLSRRVYRRLACEQ